MSILGIPPTRHNLLLQPLILALTLALIAVPCVKPQSQQNESKCVPVPAHKIKYELPKDLKGYKSSPTISYVIEMDGSVTNVKIVKSSGSKAVDEVVLDAVKKSSYRPLKLGCGPIDSRATIIIDFS
jgi:TonB family protein